jgi:hypothetical protein
MHAAVCPLPPIGPMDDNVGGSNDAGDDGGPGADADGSRRNRGDGPRQPGG